MEFEQVRDVLVEVLNIEPEKITMESDLVDDLNADSLDLADLMMTVEEVTGKAIADEFVPNLKTVGDIVTYLQNY